MNKKINIGTQIDLEDLLQSRLLIQANSGGGKSVLARTIIEESFGKVPFIIMDIEGEYYTLKEKFGDILIIGGQHADIPITLKSAKLLPKEIISNQLSVIIDLSDLQMSDRILYSKYFIESMMDLGREYWINYFIFIEEAHKLCGEQDKQVSATSIKDLMSRGRKRGYCGVLITQRISKLHKDAAAECNNKFIGRTFLDIDLERAAKELGLTSNTDKNAIRNLAPGNFYAFGTAIIPHQVHVVKINLPKTKIPKAGINMDIKPKAPTEKVKAMLAKLNTLPTEQKKEVKTTSPAFTGKSYEQEYKAAIQKSNELIWKVNFQDKIIAQLKKNSESAVKTLSINLPLFENKISIRKGDHVIPNNSTPELKVTLFNAPKPELNKCPLAIVQFLGSFPERSFSKAQIGVATSYSPNSGGFNNALSELNTKGLIIKDGAKIQASQNVKNVLGPDFEPKEYSAHTYISKLSKCEKEIYEVLLENPDNQFTKEQLANNTKTQYSANSGGFNNAISALNTLELIKRQNGLIQLNPELLELL